MHETLRSRSSLAALMLLTALPGLNSCGGSTSEETEAAQSRVGIVFDDFEEHFPNYIPKDIRDTNLVNGLKNAYLASRFAARLNDKKSANGGNHGNALHDPAYSDQLQETLQTLEATSASLRECLMDDRLSDHRWHLYELAISVGVLKDMIETGQFADGRLAGTGGYAAVDGSMDKVFAIQRGVAISLDQLCDIK